LDPHLFSIELDTLRHLLDRRLAGLVASMSLIMVMVTASQLGAPSRVPLGPLLAVGLTYLLTYAVLYLWLRDNPPTSVTAWVATTLEISIATFVVTLQMPAGVETALKSTPVLLYALATFATVARLRPTLGLYAGTLAATQWLTIFLSAHTSYTLEDPALATSTAWRQVGLRREAHGMRDARARIAFWHQYLTRGPLKSRQACELVNMLTVAALVAEGGLQREESRGTHFRSDADQRDDERFCRRIFLERAGDGAIHSEFGPLVGPSDRPAS